MTDSNQWQQAVDALPSWPASADELDPLRAEELSARVGDILDELRQWVEVAVGLAVFQGDLTAAEARHMLAEWQQRVGPQANM